MTGRFVSHDEAYQALGETAVAFTAIGVLADRAVHAFSDRARPGPARQRLTSKVDGTETAAYWVEGAAHWAAAHPQSGVVPMRVGDVGWPEFVVQGALHLRVERIHRAEVSARRMSRQQQGPDAHREHMTLFTHENEGQSPPPELTNVDLTAAFGVGGLLEGSTVSAPLGKRLLWDWDVSKDEVAACINRWRAIGNTPWLNYIDRLAMMEIRRDQAATPLTAVPVAEAGRRFVPTERTRTPHEAGVAEAENAQRASTSGGDSEGRN